LPGIAARRFLGGLARLWITEEGGRFEIRGASGEAKARFEVPPGDQEWSEWVEVP
jgi:hypothetical protein